MIIKEEMKPKEEDVNYAGESVMETKKQKERIKKVNLELNVLKLTRCIKDKDVRISKLEKRLNDRVKYFYSSIVVLLFVSLLISVLYLVIMDFETFNIWMMLIGIAASIIISIIIIGFSFYCIWDDESD